MGCSLAFQGSMFGFFVITFAAAGDDITHQDHNPGRNIFNKAWTATCVAVATEDAGLCSSVADGAVRALRQSDYTVHIRDPQPVALRL